MQGGGGPNTAPMEIQAWLKAAENSTGLDV
jgi:hypothetical protein